ncbi:UNVERIFIED_ORG: 5-methylcytosine-specific restriction protein A [Peribacillus simplex]
MKNLGDMLEYVLEHYDLSLKTDEGTKVKLLLTELIPQKIASMLSIENNLNYRVYGSFGGIPNIAFIPWVVIIDKNLCDGESAQKGIYPVLLFNEDRSEVYLSLNLGTTFFKNQVMRGKFKNTRDLINTTKIALKKLIDIESKDLDEINNLGGKKDRYYIEGNIASIAYKKNQMPSDEAFKQGLLRMMDYVSKYNKLKGDHIFEVFINKVLNNTINLPSDVQDALYQEKVDISDPEDQDDDLPVLKNKKMKTMSNRYIGNPKITKRALVNADYLCEYNTSHLTFVNDTTGKNYVEGHHLIPLSIQDEFNYSLDVPQNIVSLCPNCHRKIHKASKSQKKAMIEKLYRSREKGLIKRGIVTTQEQIERFYFN